MSSANSPPSSSDEVTWKGAFFALVPLALGAMTQPVGRVLDTPPQYRFWLRSSPILCIGDMLSFLVRVVIDYYLEPTRSWRHLKTEVAYRYRDEVWSKEPKKFDKGALGRWILIIFRGIPQTIKLLAISGIPITQTFAMMFLLSILFGEGLNFAAEAICRNPDPMPASCPPSYKSCLWLEFTTEICHSWQALITWAVPVIILRLSTIPAGISVNLKWFNIMFYAVTIFNSWMELERPRPLQTIFDSYNLSLSRQLMMATFSFIPWIVVSYIDTLRTLPGFLSTLLIMMILAVFVLFTQAIIAFLLPMLLDIPLGMLRRLSETRFGHRIGIPTDTEENRHIIIFLVNFALAVLGYAYLFDSKSTGSPSWLKVFG